MQHVLSADLEAPSHRTAGVAAGARGSSPQQTRHSYRRQQQDDAHTRIAPTTRLAFPAHHPSWRATSPNGCTVRGSCLSIIGTKPLPSFLKRRHHLDRITARPSSLSFASHELGPLLIDGPARWMARVRAVRHPRSRKNERHPCGSMDAGCRHTVGRSKRVCLSRPDPPHRGYTRAVPGGFVRPMSGATLIRRDRGNGRRSPPAGGLLP